MMMMMMIIIIISIVVVVTVVVVIIVVVVAEASCVACRCFLITEQQAILPFNNMKNSISLSFSYTQLY